MTEAGKRGNGKPVYDEGTIHMPEAHVFNRGVVLETYFCIKSYRYDSCNCAPEFTWICFWAAVIGILFAP